MHRTSKPRRGRTVRPTLESIESRIVPAVFGVPWGDPLHLTLSFAPDGTQIAGHQSSLFDTLNANATTSAWQNTILRAFQTWAAYANVNISPRVDSGAAFGAEGDTQHDVQFGDIRIGAQSMSPEVLAITVPGGPTLTGTWAGDMFLNADVNFGATGSPALFPVVLHEAGHALGLPNSNDPNSPLYPNYKNNATPTSADIAALQALFGVRQPDQYEDSSGGSGGGSSGNNSMQRATRLRPDDGLPAILFGDVTTNSDVDYFEVPVPSNYRGPLTVRVQSKGLSLLAPKVTVLSESGQALGQASKQSGVGDIVEVRLSQVTRGAKYFVRVEGTTRDIFGIGSYGVMARFDGATSADPAVVDALLSGAYGTPDSDVVEAILEGRSDGYENDDAHTDDTAAFAEELKTPAGYAPKTHYETVGSIADATDVDFYLVDAPSVPAGMNLVAAITVRARQFQGIAPNVKFLDESLKAVPTTVLVNYDGTLTLQATGLKSGARYYVQVPSRDVTGQSVALGNYALNVDYGRQAVALEKFASNRVDAATPSRIYNFYVAESQLFTFMLQANGVGAVPAGSAVSAVLKDSQGRAVLSLRARTRESISGPTIFLTPGVYKMEIAVATPAGSSTPGFSYSILGLPVSDPIGPALSDPTLRPVYTNPGRSPAYAYPGGVTSSKPYLLTLAR